MKQTVNWLYDENRQVGTDYQNLDNVIEYDKKISQFKDFKKEAEFIINTIGLKKEQSLLEIGMGTGNFAIEASKHCGHVYAIDVSKKMIGFAKEKAESQHINNISFYQSGFLNYEHSGNSLDAIVSNLALHHLPDFWKIVALKRIYNMLNDTGIFILGDVVFSFPIEDYHEKINNLVNTLKNHVDEDFAREGEIHVKEEYSTFDWIIEGMLSRAGFEYDICKKDDYFALYCCRKIKL